MPPGPVIAAIALFNAALSFPVAYKRVDWLDRREGPPRNADVEYPRLAKPALFFCTDKRCSTPMFKPEDFAAKVAKLAAQS